MNALTDPDQQPVVRYGLYTQTLAPFMVELAAKTEGATAELVPLDSPEELQSAATTWSAQLVEGFNKRQSEFPEFARLRNPPSLYTVDRIHETLGRTVHALMKVTASSADEIRRLTSEAMSLAFSSESTQ